MRYRKLGRTGIEVSVVSIGTWAMGGRDYGRVDDRDSIKAVHRALDKGINLFDTAPIYGDGRAEDVLGRALEGVRRDVVIATKCGPVVAREGLVRVDLTPEGIREQCLSSLARLRTDYLDLLQVHWPDPAYAVPDVMLAMQDLVDEGLVRAIGVSNFGGTELGQAVDTCDVASLQSRYSLLSREIEDEVLPLCRKQGLGFLAYEVLARGILSGKVTASRRFEPGDVRTGDPRFAPSKLEGLLQKVSRLASLAASEGLSTTCLAVAWVLAQPGVTSAICGAKTPAQVVDNAAAGEVDLDPYTVREAERVMGTGE